MMHETITIHVPRRLDRLTTPFFQQDMEAKIQSSRRIVLDFSKTQFVEPESAEAVLKGLMLAKQRQVKMALRGVIPQVDVVLRMAGVLHFFRKAS